MDAAELQKRILNLRQQSEASHERQLRQLQELERTMSMKLTNAGAIEHVKSDTKPIDVQIHESNNDKHHAENNTKSISESEPVQEPASREEIESRKYLLNIIEGTGGKLSRTVQIWLSKRASNEIDSIVKFLSSSNGPEIATEIVSAVKQTILMG